MTSPYPRIALVTGAGSGIGRAVAIRLHAAGYSVVLVGRRPAELDRTVALARPSSARLVPVPADVTDPASVRIPFETVSREFRRLDVLFNNAGINAPDVPFDELTFEQWTAVINVNLTGAFLCAQQAFRLMKSQQPRGGRIINNGSISAHVPRPRSAPYTSSKHAITGLTRSLSLDGRAYDIACSQIDIGNAETQMTGPMAAGALQPDGSRHSEPRMNVQHVADAVLHIAELPLDANVQFMTIMATKMPFIGRG